MSKYLVGTVANPKHNHLDDGYKYKIKDVIGYTENIESVKQYLAYNYLVNNINYKRLGNSYKWLDSEVLIAMSIDENRIYKLNYKGINSIQENVPEHIQNQLEQIRIEFEEFMYSMEHDNLRYPNNLYLSAMADIKSVDETMVEYVWQNFVSYKKITKYFKLTNL